MSFGQTSQADIAGIESRMGTFLPPVKKPQSLVLKLMFAVMRWQFGKVFTPRRSRCPHTRRWNYPRPPCKS
jgi:hypothetical protein